MIRRPHHGKRIASLFFAVPIALVLIVLLVIIKNALDTTPPWRTKTSPALPQAIPRFPLYPGAVLEESTINNWPLSPNQFVEVEWKTGDPVISVTSWYIAELSKNGWSVEPPDDSSAQSEQVVQITKDDLTGYLEVENEGEENTEILIHLTRETQAKNK